MTTFFLAVLAVHSIGVLLVLRITLGDTSSSREFMDIFRFSRGYFYLGGIAVDLLLMDKL